MSVNLGELASAAARGLTGAASTILSAPAIGVGALLYSSKAGEGSDKVPGRENGVPAALLAKRHNDANATNYSGQGREASSIRETNRDVERYSSRGDVVKHTASSQSDAVTGATRQGSQPQANYLSSAQLIKPIIKPKPRFDAKSSIPSINTPVSSKAIGADSNGIKPPLAAKPVFDSARLKARQLQALALDKAATELLEAACLGYPLCVPKLILGEEGIGSTETVPVADDLTGGKLENPLPIRDNEAVLISPDQRGEQGIRHTGNVDDRPFTVDPTTVTPIPDGPNWDDLVNFNKIIQGDHAIIRNKEGRPVGSVINDIQTSRPSDILVQDDGRWVILGDNGRVHLLEKDGEVITSFKNINKNTTQRINDGRWNKASNDELTDFKDKFNDYVRW